MWVSMYSFSLFSFLALLCRFSGFWVEHVSTSTDCFQHGWYDEYHSVMALSITDSLLNLILTYWPGWRMNLGFPCVLFSCPPSAFPLVLSLVWIHHTHSSIEWTGATCIHSLILYKFHWVGRHWHCRATMSQMSMWLPGYKTDKGGSATRTNASNRWINCYHAHLVNSVGCIPRNRLTISYH